MKADRFVLDSNVLISAALCATGAPAALVKALRRTSATLIFSKETHAELHDRLMKSKFDAYICTSLRKRFLTQLNPVSLFVFISNRPMGCRDKDDDKFLETAVYGQADCLITGDEDLLVMHPFKGIPVLRPADGLARFFPEFSSQKCIKL
ncbi:putative toxin-antitoxin system toxin component, PIN family [Desulfonatronospira sp.]|uniref:putative toxin-antitoxin system toxin component, PIN family n=1 Tax=Desulfonatronospira sp. TaxID=1962951 RepID=UPI0025BDF29A|nr:putative toxin-antitoxin system toxin component, PIN family [Desulfonatronospira sp.]